MHQVCLEGIHLASQGCMDMYMNMNACAQTVVTVETAPVTGSREALSMQLACGTHPLPCMGHSVAHSAGAAS
jgi:hypothetical protein